MMRFGRFANATQSLTNLTEIPMKKLMLAIVALMLGAAVLPGCRAEAEVDDEVRSNVGVAR